MMVCSSCFVNQISGFNNFFSTQEGQAASMAETDGYTPISVLHPAVL